MSRLILLPSASVNSTVYIGSTSSRFSREDGTELYDAPVSTSEFRTSNSVPDGLPGAIWYLNVPIASILRRPIQGVGGQLAHHACAFEHLNELSRRIDCDPNIILRVKRLIEVLM